MRDGLAGCQGRQVHVRPAASAPPRVADDTNLRAGWSYGESPPCCLLHAEVPAACPTVNALCCPGRACWSHSEHCPSMSFDVNRLLLATLLTVRLLWPRSLSTERGTAPRLLILLRHRSYSTLYLPGRAPFCGLPSRPYPASESSVAARHACRASAAMAHWCPQSLPSHVRGAGPKALTT